MLPRETINSDQLSGAESLKLKSGHFVEIKQRSQTKPDLWKFEELESDGSEADHSSGSCVGDPRISGIALRSGTTECPHRAEAAIWPRYATAVPKGVVQTAGISPHSCAKIKDLGFRASMQIKMCGERFEIVSDPFTEGDCIAVRATSGSNPEIRTVFLPIAILLGIADRFLKRPS